MGVADGAPGIGRPHLPDRDVASSCGISRIGCRIDFLQQTIWERLAMAADSFKLC